MSVNGVNNTAYDAYSTRTGYAGSTGKADTKTGSEKENVAGSAQSGVVYEKSSSADTKATYSVNKMSAEEREELGIEAIPENLYEAVNEFKNDEFVHSVLGDHIVNKLVEAKTREWQEYRERVTDWEIEEYLHKF